MASSTIRRCDAGGNAGIQDDSAAAGLCRRDIKMGKRNEFADCSN